MSLRYLHLIVLLSLLLPVGSVDAATLRERIMNSFRNAAIACAEVLQNKYHRRSIAPATETFDKYNAFRSELSAAQDQYKSSGEILDAVSMDRGIEFLALPPAPASKGHVIYFASGPDIYRALQDFPGATHFHLVDSLAGWGGGADDVIKQFQARVKSLAADCQVKVLDPGFTAFVSVAQLENRMFFQNQGHESILYRRPLILEASWVSASLGPQVKRFYLHPLRIDSESQMTELGESIPYSDSLVGMLHFGWTGLPARNPLLQLLNRLHPTGVFVFDYFRDSSNALRQYFSGPHYLTTLMLTPQQYTLRSQDAAPSDTYLLRPNAQN